MKGELVVLGTPTGRRVELHLGRQPVSWAELLYRRLRIGRARLTFGGVASVGTQVGHRKRGYSRRVMERCVEVMTEDGLDVSMLFGISGYYDKFGYRTALCDYEFAIAGRELARDRQRLIVRHVRPGEHATTFPLYRRDLPHRAMGTERQRHLWRRMESGAGRAIPAEVTGFYEGERLAGYVVCDGVPNAVRVGELVAPSPEVLASAFAYLGRQCRRKVVETVTFDLPPDHPAAAIAVDLGATFTRRTFRNAAGMMRILNLDSLLAAMEAELATRWQASAMGHCGLELTVHTDVGRGKLLLAGTRRSSAPMRGRIRIGQDRLIQLITGYVGASAMAERPEVGIPRNLLPAMAAVFPERNAHILRTNRF